MLSLLLHLMLVMPGISFSGGNPLPYSTFRPGTEIRDTADLIGHRWLVVSMEKSGKKMGATAGSMPLYMNFFSNGGFDFVGIGDGDLLVWRYAKGSVIISRKSSSAEKPEAVFRIEKITGKTMSISGMQAGAPVRYVLSHQAGE